MVEVFFFSLVHKCCIISSSSHGIHKLFFQIRMLIVLRQFIFGWKLRVLLKLIEAEYEARYSLPLYFFFPLVIVQLFHAFEHFLFSLVDLLLRWAQIWFQGQVIICSFSLSAWKSSLASLSKLFALQLSKNSSQRSFIPYSRFNFHLLPYKEVLSINIQSILFFYDSYAFLTLILVSFYFLLFPSGFYLQGSSFELDFIIMMIKDAAQGIFYISKPSF